MKIEVTVTQEDIALGGHQCFNCPVHRAISRAMGPKRPAIAVNRTALVIRGETVIGFPATIESWIWDYDAGAKVGPISFELELP